MKITQNTADTLVINTRGGFATQLMIPLLCLFLWLHWISFADGAPAWVHGIIGTFTVLIALIVLRGPERSQIVMDRNTGKVELRQGKGRAYQSRRFDLDHIAGIAINPNEKGFAAKPGPMERVFIYLHVTGGMDAGHHLLTNYKKSPNRARTAQTATAQWLARKTDSAGAT